MTWWEREAIYEIYVRSFQDSDGDGIGDLAGITRRIPYLRWLGVGAIWLTPFYESPLRDFGYDVSDHTAIDPTFGTLADFDRLVAEAHRNDVRVVVDYVPNHTSDLHPWFAESRASRESPKRDWYIWRDEDPPSNWRSMFGGSAWTRDDASGQSYYHAFLREQPDLNWRNPAVRKAMLDVLRFWIDHGVDGFRVDAIRQLLKDPDLRDNPPNPDFQEGMPEYDTLIPRHTTDLDELQEIVAAMRAVIGDERLMLPEVKATIERLMRYYGDDGQGAHLPFNFHLMNTPWRPEAIAGLVERYEAALPAAAWPNWVLGNHDRERPASRVGPEQARAAAMLLLTLRGTATLYYGDELGMADVPIPPERVVDPDGRDPQRTPMPWTGEPGAGFCPPGVEPWLPMGDPAVNVAAQRDDPGSMLTLHRRLLGLRRAREDLATGAYETLQAGDGLLAYARGRHTVVALNLSGEPRALARTGDVLLGTHGRGGEHARSELRLAPGEGVLLDVG